jgi:hypothetical protein
MEPVEQFLDAGVPIEVDKRVRSVRREPRNDW